MFGFHLPLVQGSRGDPALDAALAASLVENNQTHRLQPPRGKHHRLIKMLTTTMILFRLFIDIALA